MFGIRKRNAQERLNKNLFNTGLFDKGTIIGLLGPEPKKYIKSLQEYNLGKTIILHEIDPKRQKLAGKPPNNNVIYLGEDIFNSALRISDISGIDFDFCESLRKDLHTYISLQLVEISENTRDSFWLRITAAIAPNHGKELTLDRCHKIVEFLESQTSYKKLGRYQKFVYKDTRAMLVYQVKLTKGETKMKTTKKSNVHRTMKNLTPTERQMVKDLVGLDYSATDIGVVFNLSTNSVGSLKAHQTMRRNNNA